VGTLFDSRRAAAVSRAAVPLALLLLAASCSSGSHKVATNSAAGGDSSTTAPTATTIGAGASGANGATSPSGGAGGAGAGAGVSSSGGAGGASGSSGGASSGQPAGPATGAGAGAGAPGASPSTGSGPAPVLTGTWHYHQTGAATIGQSNQPIPAEGTLVVDALKADHTQTSHRYVDPNKAPSDTTLLFRSDGMFLTGQVNRSTVGSQTVAFTCTFSPPMPIPPWPPAVGQHFTGDGNCGSFTVHVDAAVTATKAASVGGTSVPTYVIQSTIATHGQVESTINETDWFAPSLRLSVHVEAKSQGKYGFFSFSSNTVSELEGLKPT
jgi:hypothetical protein